MKEVAGKRKPTALEAFELNMEDADQLVLLAEILTNRRVTRMRSEKRASVGRALRIPLKSHDDLDWIESDDVFVILKPGARLHRGAFDQREPLLRQSIVAGCAALETYIADQAVARVRKVINAAGPLPPALARVGMDVGQWHDVETAYPTRRRAITDVVLEPHIRQFASTSPSQVGQLLSMVGLDKGLSRVDGARNVRKGSTQSALEEITRRRNKIAHEGDRHGRGRAPITIDTAQSMLDEIRSIAEGLGKVFDN